MKISDFLALFSAQPKTLDQAKGTLDASKGFADSVSSLFAAAGLDLDKMLAAGPDSLKAHIDSFKAADEQLAKANEAIAKHGEEVAKLNQSLVAASDEVKKFSEVFASIGYVAADGADMKESFHAHVKQQAALELAKIGHPPVQKVDPNATGVAQKSDKEHYLVYAGMPAGPEKTAYFAKHGEAIWNGREAK